MLIIVRGLIVTEDKIVEIDCGCADKKEEKVVVFDCGCAEKQEEKKEVIECCE